MRRWFPVLAVLVSACSSDPNLVDYGVYGTVTDAATDSPVSGIDVTFTSDTLIRASDETDGDGRYEIVVLSDTPFGHLTTRDPRGRYEREIVEVYFDEDTRRVDIRLGRIR